MDLSYEKCVFFASRSWVAAHFVNTPESWSFIGLFFSSNETMFSWSGCTSLNQPPLSCEELVTSFAAVSGFLFQRHWNDTATLRNQKAMTSPHLFLLPSTCQGQGKRNAMTTLPDLRGWFMVNDYLWWSFVIYEFLMIFAHHFPLPLCFLSLLPAVSLVFRHAGPYVPAGRSPAWSCRHGSAACESTRATSAE